MSRSTTQSEIEITNFVLQDIQDLIESVYFNEGVIEEEEIYNTIWLYEYHDCEWVCELLEDLGYTCNIISSEYDELFQVVFFME